jgi:hypothetical protein
MFATVGGMPETMQSVLLTALLARHPRLVDITALSTMLAEDGHPDVDAQDLDIALNLLLGDGLATRLGDLVGASWIAARATQLHTP